MIIYFLHPLHTFIPSFSLVHPSFSIDLSIGNKIISEGIQEICSALDQRPYSNLKRLDLRSIYTSFFSILDNNIGVEGVRYLAKCIHDHKLVHLETLCLACISLISLFYSLDNFLTSQGTIELMSSMSHSECPQLKVLDLGGIQNLLSFWCSR